MSYYYKPEFEDLFEGFSKEERSKLFGKETAGSFQQQINSMFREMQETYDWVEHLENVKSGKEQLQQVYGNVPPNIDEIIEQAKTGIIDTNKQIEQMSDLLTTKKQGLLEGSIHQDRKLHKLDLGRELQHGGLDEMLSTWQGAGHGNLSSFLSDTAPTRQESGLAEDLLSFGFGALTGGAGWLLPAMIGAIPGVMKAEKMDANPWLGAATGALKGYGGAKLGGKISNFLNPDTSGLQLTPEQVANAQGADASWIPENFSERLQGGSDMGLFGIEDLLQSPNYLDDIGGVGDIYSDITSSGGEPFGLNNYLNFEDILTQLPTATSSSSGSVLSDLFRNAELYGSSGGYNLGDIGTDLGLGGSGWLDNLLGIGKDVGKNVLENQVKKLLGGGGTAVQGGGGTPATGDKETSGANWLTNLINSLFSGGGGATGTTGAGGGAYRPPGVNRVFPDFPELTSAKDILSEAQGQLGKFEAGPEFYEQFGPTSLEEAVANKFFAQNLEKARREAGQIASIRGMDSLAEPIFTERIGPTITSIGEYLANQASKRAGQSYAGRLQGLSQYMPMAQTQSNKQAAGDFGVAGLRTDEQFQRELANALQNQAKTGLVSNVVGAGAGGILNKLFPQMGISTPQAMMVGAGMGGMVSPLFGGGASPVDLSNALMMASSMGTQPKSNNLFGEDWFQKLYGGTP